MGYCSSPGYYTSFFFKRDTGGVLFLVLCILIVLAAGYVQKGTLYKSEIINSDIIIPVNGYYLDLSGNYVTASNVRGALPGYPEVRENVLKNPPYLLTVKRYYKPNFWIALFPKEDVIQKVSFEDYPDNASHIPFLVVFFAVLP